MDEIQKKETISHDESFKKLIQTFFKEFIDLFFPKLSGLLDFTQTRFLMQELLVDIVGQEARTLDLLLETRYKAIDAYVLVHFEPQAYADAIFHERMFIYFSRLFERYRKEHKLIIPIAIFSGTVHRDVKDAIEMSIPDHNILHFEYLKVELSKQNWRQFVDSDNPVAAALLVKMEYNKKERRELRLAYLRMILRLHKKLDEAQLALVMSIADLYYEPDPEEDQEIIRELGGTEEGGRIMELMPAWKRWGFEEGIEKGIEQGRMEVISKLLQEGVQPEVVAKWLNMPVDQIVKTKE